jgi:hypothetical protein
MDKSNLRISHVAVAGFGEKKVPMTFFGIVIVYLFYCAFFTPNFQVTFLVAIFPLFLYRLLWIDRQPNVLFWGIMLQWLTSVTQLLYCNFLSITLEERAKKSGLIGSRLEDATTYSLIGLYVFTFGLYLIIKNIKHQNIDLFLPLYSPKRVLYFYIGVSIFFFLTSSVIWYFTSFVQYFYFFAYIKWGFFVITFYIVNKNAPSFRLLLYIFIAFEVILSLASFFAGNFLNIFCYLFLSLVLVQPKIKIRFKFFIVLVLIGVTHLLILWSAIKVDYRSYVASGKVTQSIQVSRTEAIDELASLISNVDEQQYKRGIEAFVDRLGYINFFAAALEYVPEKVPHQNGDIYFSAVNHYLIPRFLNPNKKQLDDTKHTQYFTGMNLSGSESATSFSLGYIADAYIDFGPYYMYIILFFFGVLFGIFYKFLYTKSLNEIWSWIFTVPFFLLININGMDTNKALGWILIYFLVISIVRKQLIKRLDPLMR